MSSLAELVALLNRRRRENQDNDYQGEYFDPQVYNDNQALVAGTGAPGKTVFEQEAADSLRRQNRNSTPVGPVYPVTTDFGGEPGKTLFDQDSDDLLRRRNIYDESGGVKEPGVFGGGQAGADAYVGGSIEGSDIPDVSDKLNKLMLENEEKYKYMKLLPMEAKLPIFYSIVHNGAIYDLKNQPDWQSDKFIYNGELIDKDVPGNMHYGYLGKVFGFPDTLLYAAAGLAQIRAKTSNKEWLNFDNFGDDPRDTESIRKGIEYYNKVQRDRIINQDAPRSF